MATIQSDITCKGVRFDCFHVSNCTRYKCKNFRIILGRSLFLGINGGKQHPINRSWICSFLFPGWAYWYWTLILVSHPLFEQITFLVETVNSFTPYSMFLFPDTPNFSSNLGEPLLLSPLIEKGQMAEARHVTLQHLF